MKGLLIHYMNKNTNELPPPPPAQSFSVLQARIKYDKAHFQQRAVCNTCFANRGLVSSRDELTVRL
jgi:sulfur relay (sulfurtransferase) complex TusBCD TusD component (DsrE family)